MSTITACEDGTKSTPVMTFYAHKQRKQESRAAGVRADVEESTRQRHTYIEGYKLDQIRLKQTKSD
jgi:hypothetical protein